MGDMGHRHLVLAYSATFLIHLAYLTYVAVKSRAARRAEKRG